MTRATGVRRTKYSHNGCKECKRRKIKCDEGRPNCWNCDRLDKHCLYQHRKNGGLNIRDDVVAGSRHKTGSRELVNAESNTPSPTHSSTTAHLHHSVEEHDDPFTAYWTPLLANDLSGLVNSTLSELTAISEPVTFNQPMPEGNSPSDAQANELIFQTNVPLSYISLKGDDSFYMNEFYSEFSNIILPFQVDLDGTMINPVRDILMIYARDSHYLLYSLLACGARSSHRKSSLSDDQSSYKLYLRRCLETLTSAMERNMRANLDSILLTILVLTCDSASHARQEWRAHLCGAKELLLTKDVQESHSMIFSLCRTWYSSIEILAGLVSPNGGTLKSGKELDLLIMCNRVEEISALRRLNIINAEGFNLFHGYSVKLIELLKNLIKLLSREGESRKKYCEIIDLITGVKQQLNLQVITEKAANTTESHYLSTRLVDKETNTLPKSESTHTSYRKTTSLWLNITHRSNALAALITIFTRLLNVNKEDEIIQCMVTDLINTACSLDEAGGFPKSYCSFVLQWPMLVAGSNSIRDEDKMKVDIFFRLLAQFGSGSAGLVLARIRKIWLGESAVDKEISSDIDLVTY